MKLLNKLQNIIKKKQLCVQNKGEKINLVTNNLNNKQMKHNTLNKI